MVMICTGCTGVSLDRTRFSLAGSATLAINRYRGVTLIEIIVVVILIAVLLSTILPAYQGQVIDVRRELAWAELLKVTARQEQFFLNHGRYAETLTALGLPDSPYAIDSQGRALAAIAGGRIYLVSLVTRQGGYTLLAAPQQGQVEDRLCGTLSVDSQGRRRSAGPGSLQECR